MRRAVAFALACVTASMTASVGASATAAPVARSRAAVSAECRGSATASIDALQLLELQISYTTLLARYYEPVDPNVVVRGAHAGVAGLLRRCGIVDRRSRVARPHQDASERIDTDFLTAVAAYGRRVSSSALVSEIISGELAELHDPYTLLFRPVAFKAFDTFLQGERFGGIGIVLDLSGAAPRIASVIASSPAERAGLASGDMIRAIDGTSASGLSAGRLRDLLRGKPGTVVRVTIARDVASLGAATGDATPPRSLTFSIVREIVRDPQTVARVVAPGVGYVQLSRFGDGAAEEVAARFAALARDGATRFVLDLRENGGGYGDAATGVASIFIASGTIFSTHERTGAPVYERARSGASVTAPLVVLVNHDTASASEIVAGALQDDRRATIVGERTFGKGVVQSVFPLPDGAAIKMTTARYFTPTGRSIERVGIVPDVPVAEPSDARLGDPERDPQLARALEILPPTADPAPSPAP